MRTITIIVVVSFLVCVCLIVFARAQVAGRKVPLADSALAIDTGYAPLQTAMDARAGGGSAWNWADSSSFGPDSVLYSDTAGAMVDVGTIANVDTTGADKHEVLVWNGSKFIMAPYDTVLTFSINTATNTESSTQLIGLDGNTWKADGGVSFTATYLNGPPDSAHVRWNGSTPAGMEDIDSAHANTDITDGSATSSPLLTYPSGKDVTVTFRVSAYFLPDHEAQAVTPSITFRNLIWYGKDGKNSGFSEADVESFSNNVLSNDNTTTWGIFDPGVSEYLVLAYPANYTLLDGGDDYETDGPSDFRHNGITCAMADAHELVSITNSAGYVENYDVWASTTADLPNGSFYTSTSSTTTINQIFWGKTSTASGYADSDIHGLADSSKTNQDENDWTATAGVGEYLLWARPKRLCDSTVFVVGGFEGGWEYPPETVTHTNFNGWTEDYFVYRSTNTNLGLTTWTTTCGD